jgi:hypothetical protein
MLRIAKTTCLLAALSLPLLAHPAPLDGQGSIMVVFKDGHRQNIDMSDLTRIDFKSPVVLVFKNGHQESIASSDIARIEFEDSSVETSRAAINRFVGKWEVGEGNGGKFMITLDANGEAKKSIGATHGTWTVVDNEARISWDDGWHDAIRKVGTKHEKLAYEPGKTFNDKPSNVTEAHSASPKPI